MKALILVLLVPFFAHAKLSAGLSKEQLVKKMIKSDTAQFNSMLTSSKIEESIKDKKTKEQFVKDVKQINKEFKSNMEKFLNKNYKQKELEKLNTTLESKAFKKFHTSLNEKMKEQAAFQMFVQKDEKSKMSKKQIKKIDKIDSIVGYTYALDLNMNNTIDIVRHQIAKQKGATKEMVEMATAAFKANIQNVSDNAIYFTLKDLDDKKLDELLKLIDDNKLKKYFKTMNDLSNEVSKKVMGLVRKYKLGGT